MRSKLEERCLEFGVEVINLIRNNGKDLTPRSREQLVSSATSIGANVAEARSGQSRADFISKMEIALKEARETGLLVNGALSADKHAHGDSKGAPSGML